ncbi:MAG: lytic transglycosylase domain-containing protein [Oligoflexia bacterium]|nr:lytic transglycosylase domain-containing protein [Oligoflexia bacterium]
MGEKKRKKVTIVRAHRRRVPVSSKNPTGVTIVDRHPRQLHGPALSAQDLRSITATRDRKGLVYPKDGKLGFRDGNRYDELIAVWVDFFNEKFGVTPPDCPLDPDVIKALIASESGFEKNPKNPQAIGIAQITPETLRILLNPEGETKDFIFKGIRQKDLKDPELAIPMGIRWIFRKRRLAEGKLGRGATPEEIVLEYKGLLGSKSEYQQQALKKFREHYAILKKK